MKKIFTKIIGATLGLTMALGVGIGVASNVNKGIKPVQAAYSGLSPYSITLVSGAGGASGTVRWQESSESLANSPSDGVTWVPSVTWEGTSSWTNSNVHTQIGANGKAASSVTLTTSDIPGTISSVAVMCASYQGKHTINVSVGGNAYTMDNSATPSWSSSVDTARTGTGSSSGEIVVSFASTTGARALYVKSITVVFDSGAPTVESVSVGGDMSKTSYTTVETWSNDGLTPEVTMSDSSEYTGEIAWSYEPATPSAAVIANSGAEVADLSVTATASAGGESGSKATSGISVNYATVAQGRAAVPNLNDQINNAIVVGIVSYIEEISIENHNATYFISDDGTRDSEIEIYRGKGVDNANIGNVNDIKVNDTVVVYGNLKYVNFGGGTVEFLSNNYLLVLDRPASLEPEITITESNFSMRVGDNDLQLHETHDHVPDGGYIGWESGTPSVATIDNTGLVHAVAAGTSVLTAKIFNSSDEAVASNSINVTIFDNVLVDGSTYIVKAVYNEQTYYLSGVSNGNLGVASTTRSDAWVLTAIASNAEGQFQLKYGNYYLNCTNSNNLYITTNNTLETTIWTVLTNGTNSFVENVTNAGRKLQFNYNAGNPRFACYTSNQTAVIVEEATAPVVDQITVSGDTVVDAANALSVDAAFTYEVTYADLLNVGPGAVAVSVTNSVGTTEGAVIKTQPAAGSFEITFSANDTFTITATALEDPASSGSFAVTITNIYVPNVNFCTVYQGTDVSGDMKLIEGDYVFYYSGNLMKAAIESNKAAREEAAPSVSPVDVDASLVWHVAPAGEYYTIYNAAEGKYLAATATKNQAQLLADGTDNKAKWTVTIRADGKFEFENYARSLIEGSDSDNRWLRNNGESGWACYTSAIGGGITLFRHYYSSMSTVAAVIGTETAGVVDSVSLAFGAKMFSEDWEALTANHEVTDYGFALIRKDTLDANSLSSVSEAYGLSLTYNISKGSGANPYQKEGYYYFSVKIRITEGEPDYGTLYCAAPYIVVDGSPLFLNDMVYSVNTLAAYCLVNGGSNLSNEALGTLVA